MNDGSVSIGGIPDDFAFGEFSVNGKGTFARDGLSDATVSAALLANTAGAASTLQQVSPAVEWIGQGWAAAPVASQRVSFQAYVSPVFQSGANPIGTWRLERSINGMVFGGPLAFGSDGGLVVAGNITTAGELKAASFSGGGATFGVVRSGSFVSTVDGSANAPAFSFAADNDTGLYRPAANTLGLVTGAGERMRLTATGIQIGTQSFGFGTSTAASDTDTILVRDGAANSLALRNGTNGAQTFRQYETHANNGTDHARLSLATLGGNYLIRSEANGTGALRTLQVGSGEKLGTNSYGVDTILHAGQGTGSMAGGAIHFQFAPPGSPLQTGWLIGATGQLTAGGSGKDDRVER